MAAKKESELSSQHRDVYRRARAAAESKNYDYVIMLLPSLVKQEPRFLDGRKLLRLAQIHKFKTVSDTQRKMLSVKTTPMMMKVNSAASKTPDEVFAAAEEIIAIDPFHYKANIAMAEAAMKMEFSELAIFCHETVHQGDPKNTENLHGLAKLYMTLGDMDKAQATYQKIIDVDPRDGEALSGLKNASAAGASKKGGWDEAQDFRSLIKNKDEAAQLEQASKVVKSVDAVMEQINLIYAKQQADPQNTLYPKQIGALYAQIEDEENAIAWYQYAYDVGSAADTSLEKVIFDLKVKRLERKHAEAQSSLDAATDEATRAEQQQVLDAVLAEKNEFVLESAKQRVARYPNEAQYHFDLGAAYYNMGKYKEALPELQMGTRQPNVRLKALCLIGSSYWKRNMMDLAIKTFQSAAAEIQVMDDTKKEIVYNLAQVYETTGKNAEAIEQYKQIYEVDMVYRDVAAKVEASYENPPS